MLMLAFVPAFLLACIAFFHHCRTLASFVARNHLITRDSELMVSRQERNVVEMNVIRSVPCRPDVQGEHKMDTQASKHAIRMGSSNIVHDTSTKA